MCVVFDKQFRGVSIKDSMRQKRDEGSTKICPDVLISDDAVLPTDYTWMEFLANRQNKQQLVVYIVEKLKASFDRLHNDHVLIISAEDNAWEVARDSQL